MQFLWSLEQFEARSRHLPTMPPSPLIEQAQECEKDGAKFRLKIFHEEYCPFPANLCAYQSKERTFVKIGEKGTSYFGCEYSKIIRKI